MPGATAARLGKRKRSSQRSVSVQDEGLQDSSPSDSSVDEHDAHDAFRRAFEKRFAPLPSTGIPKRPSTKTSKRSKQQPAVGADELEDMRSDDESDDEFSGLSDDSEDEDQEDEGADSSDAASDERTIQVVDATTSYTPTATPNVRPPDAKSFMSSKPPSSLSTDRSTSNHKSKHNAKATTTASTDAAAAAAATEEEEAAHKVNDLALHRLLTESHLLSHSPHATLSHQPHSTPAAGATASQKPRSLRAAQLALRVSALGGAPAPKQRMPLAHARGIAARQVERERERRREAREAGIVLERPAGDAGAGGKSSSKKKNKARDGGGRRERGVGAPSVGRFEGGTLRLSARDLRGLTSSAGERGRGRGSGKGKGKAMGSRGGKW